jgi:hypothetical protein
LPAFIRSPSCPYGAPETMKSVYFTAEMAAHAEKFIIISSLGPLAFSAVISFQSRVAPTIRCLPPQRQWPSWKIGNAVNGSAKSAGVIPMPAMARFTCDLHRPWKGIRPFYCFFILSMNSCSSWASSDPSSCSFCSSCSARSNLPISAYASPRYSWASARSGLSSMAF